MSLGDIVGGPKLDRAWPRSRWPHQAREDGAHRRVAHHRSCMVYLLIAGFAGCSDRRAAAVVGGESALFAANGFRCPLTDVAESLGAESGSVTDIYLPKRYRPLAAGDPRATARARGVPARPEPSPRPRALRLRKAHPAGTEGPIAHRARPRLPWRGATGPPEPVHDRLHGTRRAAGRRPRYRPGLVR